MNPSQPGNKSNWANLLVQNPEAFMQAFRNGQVDTDAIQAQDIAGAASGNPHDVIAQAVMSTYASTNGGVLTMYGDALDNNVSFSRDAAGNILVNNGAIPVTGGTPTVLNTTLIQAFGQGGNDTITLNEANGALPRSYLFGGTGNDTLTGGSGADLLFGQSGNDTLIGKGGVDLLFGGSENDVLVGGDANDQMYGEAGDDRMIWNPGDDSDLMEGGAGIDTAEVNGGGGSEQFTVTANGTRVRFDRLDPAPFALDVGTTENLVVNMNGGDDTFSATGNLASLINLTVDGGAGNDTILGGNGADLLQGGTGHDFIDGQQGNDVALLGDGDDRFQWDPGDGSDTVDGQAGNDAVLMNGSNGAEVFGLAANGGHAMLTRNLGNIVMDLAGVEAIDLKARDGADVVTVNDMTGTGVTNVYVDLAAIPGGVGDTQADLVVVNAGNSADTIDVFAAGSSVSVIGLAAQVAMTGLAAADQLAVNGLGGDDNINASTVPGGIVGLTIDGGSGDDAIFGSVGADNLRGGDNDDFVYGNGGNDVALLGAGDDVFQWNPGNGNDIVEGQEGVDQLVFHGANVAETVDIFANGGRVTFFRNVANVTMDLDDVEQIDFRALGGADSINLGDFTGTDVKQVYLDLRGPNGGGDGAADRVTLQGTAGNDTITVSGAVGAPVVVAGLPAQVTIGSAEAALDRLVMVGGAGADAIDASALASGVIGLEVHGGLGDDTVHGSAGGDYMTGGDGNDVARMGAGDDLFTWNPGDDNDTVVGDAGFDTLLFNGANAAETISLSANAGNAVLARDIATVTMNLDNVEGINLRALGEADRIFVNDLSGTDVVRVDLDLSASTGAGDTKADTVTVAGTTGDDVFVVTGDAIGVAVSGLAAQVNIVGAEAAYDRLVVMAGDGADVIDGTVLASSAMGFTADGGIGDDVLIGGAGNDILLGGEGDDILLGGDGDDVLDGGAGIDVLIGGAGNDTLLNGEYAVEGFMAGAGSEDKIDLRSLSGLTFEWLLAHATTVDGNAVLDLGNGEHITLRGVAVGALHGDDFLMGP
jgi:Ca2+-binding RTX toxin-like protein